MMISSASFRTWPCKTRCYLSLVAILTKHKGSDLKWIAQLLFSSSSAMSRSIHQDRSASTFTIRCKSIQGQVVSVASMANQMTMSTTSKIYRLHKESSRARSIACVQRWRLPSASANSTFRVTTARSTILKLPTLDITRPLLWPTKTVPHLSLS